MKNLKVYVGALAIVLALASSFTTARFATDWYTVSGNVIQSDFVTVDGTSDYNQIGTYSSTSPLSDAAVNLACTGSTYVCAFSIPEHTQDGVATLTQADLNTISRNPSTFALKFKN